MTIVGDKNNVNSMGGPVTYGKYMYNRFDATYLWPWINLTFSTVTNPLQIFRYLKGYIFGPRYACVSLLTKSEYLEKVVALGERGELKVEIQEVIEGAFDEHVQGWKKATDSMESMRVRGKVVLLVP